MRLKKKILLLGSTGKLGWALTGAFSKGYRVVGKGSRDLDAADFSQVGKLIADVRPDIVMNAVAFLGIDPCEEDPQKAFRLNTLLPKFLAERSREKGFLLVHFSTDAVFCDRKRGCYTEEMQARPLNVYGLTKYGGDCFVSALAARHYIFRLSVLFGETPKENQFVEKMLARARQGQKVLRVSADISMSPTYSRDAALCVKRVIEGKRPYGLYHVANEGQASLYELMKEVVKKLKLDVSVEKAAYKDFPYKGVKNTRTPISSVKIAPLRPWKEAVGDYCLRMKERTQGA